jgi:hypothetical protein
MRYLIVAFLVLIVLAAGCVGNTGSTNNETTEYEYYENSGNNSGNQTPVVVGGDFMFKVYGETEFWLKPNRTIGFYVVFNNRDEDMETHEFVARAHPSAADFDVMAAYQCLHFTTCEQLLSDMRLMIDQPEANREINYTKVDLYEIRIRVPEEMPKGTYMYNIVACKDMSFDECTETQTNFGPNVGITVHVF